MGVWSYTILSLGIFLKIVLFLYCTAVNIKAKSDQLSALAEDHLNDGSWNTFISKILYSTYTIIIADLTLYSVLFTVFSNSAAIIAIIIASNVDSAWWVDPIGAITISLVIIYRYTCMCASFTISRTDPYCFYLPFAQMVRSDF